MQFSNSLKYLFILALVTYSLISISNKNINAQEINNLPTVVINEFMANPVGSDSDYEWLELFNYGKEEINLKNWKINSKNLFEEDTFLEPLSFLVISRNKNSLIEMYPELINIYQSNISLNNSNFEITLSNEKDISVDSYSYSSSEEGKSWERVGLIENDECKLWEINSEGNSMKKKMQKLIIIVGIIKL